MKTYEEYVQESYEGMLSLIKELCAIPAPSHHEEKRAEFCKKWFEENVGPAYIDEALNAVCPVNVTEDNEVVIIMAHTDTVFPDTEPMPFVEEEGKWYCPGIGDDTANLVNLMYAARYTAMEKLVPECGVVFVANSCEEGLGNLKGSRQLQKDFAGRVREVISFDGGMRGITNEAVGSHRYTIKVSTEGGHSWGSFGNRNAIHVLSSIISSLYTIKVPVIGNSRTTYNVGTISGGTSVNTIAQDAEMLFEYRSDNRECLAKMKTMLENTLEAYRSYGADISCELIGERPCTGDVDRERQSVLEERAKDILRSVTGSEPFTGSGSTDCNIPLSMGIPAVCYGTVEGRGGHTRQEYIVPESMKKGQLIALKTVGYYFGR